MQYTSLLSALLMGLAVSAEARQGGFRGARHNPKVAQNPAATTTSSAAVSTPFSNSSGSSNSNSAALELNPANVATGSESDGLEGTGVEAGQAASATDPANFINFCTGKTLTNGLQNTAGSCNGIVMGDIPAKTNMVSTVITFPQNGQDIAANQTFSFAATSINMVFGSFTNAKSTYYSAPQALDKATGNIIGHLHFTVQALSDANVKTPLDPTVFAFFKGVNDAGDNKGDLTALVTGGLAPGSYRACTMTSASNHQPVLMPVAQRGPQDDCIRFTVGQGNAASGSGSGASSGSGSGASSGSATSSAVASGVTTAAAVSSSEAVSATTSAANVATTAASAASGSSSSAPKNGGSGSNTGSTSGSSCNTGSKKHHKGKKAHKRAVRNFEA